MSTPDYERMVREAWEKVEIWNSHQYGNTSMPLYWIVQIGDHIKSGYDRREDAWRASWELTSDPIHQTGERVQTVPVPEGFQDTHPLGTCLRFANGESCVGCGDSENGIPLEFYERIGDHIKSGYDRREDAWRASWELTEKRLREIAEIDEEIDLVFRYREQYYPSDATTIRRTLNRLTAIRAELRKGMKP